MRHKARVAEYLGHIAEAVRRAIGYVEPLPDAEALRQAKQLQDAVIRNLEVIGEAANRIMRATRNSWRHIPTWPGSGCEECATR